MVIVFVCFVRVLGGCFCSLLFGRDFRKISFFRLRLRRWFFLIFVLSLRVCFCGRQFRFGKGFGSFSMLGYRIGFIEGFFVVLNYFGSRGVFMIVIKDGGLVLSREMRGSFYVFQFVLRVYGFLGRDVGSRQKIQVWLYFGGYQYGLGFGVGGLESVLKGIRGFVFYGFG